MQTDAVNKAINQARKLTWMPVSKRHLTKGREMLRGTPIQRLAKLKLKRHVNGFWQLIKTRIPLLKKKSAIVWSLSLYTMMNAVR